MSTKKAIAPFFQDLLLKDGIIKDQVYSAIRNAILDGVLMAGARIPSSRALAEMMAISRNSVIAGLHRLLDEGYLETRKGSGTFVAQSIPESAIGVCQPGISPESRHFSTDQLNADITAVSPLWIESQKDNKNHRLFTVGVGCTDLFPHALWGRLLGRVWRQSKRELGLHTHPGGYKPLRRAISAYIKTTRGVHCHEDQVIIVNGIQQALNITAKALLSPGSEVWLDDPGYNGARGAFTAGGAVVRPVRVDTDGIDINDGIAHYSTPRLVYTAPSHQFPLGGTLSLSRRLALLEWAHVNQTWIFEDDYNSEFRYATRSVQALQGLDKYNRVIYSGTFSKMMYPEFRLGFLVAPAGLQDYLLNAKYISDVCTGYLEQAVLARFIEEGHYASHVRRIRKKCYERKMALIAAIDEYLAHKMIVHPSDSGIHLVCWLQNGLKGKEVEAKARQHGMGIQSLDRYCQRPPAKEGILLGFANHSPDVLRQGIRQLAQII
ncbi:PLP-dependent aminotransferase family protein [Superficieibacter electus]|uniref:PLP-dependent aminotransferase family protein n=1 Tax=Superficieibacter electus TaxID=2022662 RepID=A0A2P5GPC6_9ENTR|nr:PLP-dependent aminotransferase family protein [Superficieibacter electus]POP45028.1 PLP-dependent aminotransferase family protein [Superficieibacter electus]POP48415.1 PLP-dependent aminotransferase family protein [Superficieibacter electus]